MYQKLVLVMDHTLELFQQQQIYCRIKMDLQWYYTATSTWGWMSQEIVDISVVDMERWTVAKIT